MAKQQQFPALKTGPGLVKKVVAVVLLVLVAVAVAKGPAAAADLVRLVIDGVVTFARSF